MNTKWYNIFGRKCVGKRRYRHDLDTAITPVSKYNIRCDPRPIFISFGFYYL